MHYYCIIEDVFTNGQIKIRDLLISKGVKAAHCLKFDASNKLLQLNYATGQFEIGPSRFYNLPLQDAGIDADILNLTRNDIFIIMLLN